MVDGRVSQEVNFRTNLLTHFELIIMCLFHNSVENSDVKFVTNLHDIHDSKFSS